MLDKRKRKSAKTKTTEQTLEQPQRLDPDAEDEFGAAQDCQTTTADSELLEDVHFMEYTERYMNNDLYDDEANAARFFFPTDIRFTTTKKTRRRFRRRFRRRLRRRF